MDWNGTCTKTEAAHMLASLIVRVARQRREAAVRENRGADVAFLVAPKDARDSLHMAASRPQVFGLDTGGVSARFARWLRNLQDENEAAMWSDFTAGLVMEMEAQERAVAHVSAG